MAAVATMGDGGRGSGLREPFDDNSLSGESVIPPASAKNSIELISGAISKTNIKKRQEQIQRWELSETNKYPDIRTTRDPEESKSKAGVVRVVGFLPGVKFLAACSAKDFGEVERLLRAGTDINSANIDGLTALHQACIDDSFEVFKYLVDNGCDVDARDSEGWTALHAAASCGFLEMTKYLIAHEARLDMVNNDGDLAVDLAEDMNIKNLISAGMMAQGIDCDAARRQEENMMMENAKHWLTLGSYEEEPDPVTGATALHVAAAKGYDDVIRMLLDVGAGINAQDIDGWTPLHAAAHWAQKEATKILSERMANFEITTKLGETVLDLADEELEEYVKELQKAQEKMRQDNDKKDTSNCIMMRHLFKDKRRSSITRLSLEQRQSMLSKNTEEERAQLEAAMRHSAVVEEVEEEAVREAQVEGGSVKMTQPTDASDNMASATSVESTQNKAPSTLPSVPESPTILTPSLSSSVAPDESESSTVGTKPTDASTGTVPGYSTRFDIRRTSHTENIAKPAETSVSPLKRHSVPISGYSGSPSVPPTASLSARLNALTCHVASLTARSSQSDASASTPRRLDLRKPSGSTSGEEQTSAASKPATSSDVTAISAGTDSSKDNNKPLPAKTEEIGTRSKSTDADAEESMTPRARAPLLSSATAAALAAIANQRRSIELPKRDEAKEVERRVRARKARETRRSTQGVTKEDMESAEQALQAAAAAAMGSAAAAGSRSDSVGSSTVSDTASTISMDSSSSGTSSTASLSSHASSTAAADTAGKRTTSSAAAAAPAANPQEQLTAAARTSALWPLTERRESDSSAEIRRSYIPGATIGSPSSLARRELRNSVPAVGSLDSGVRSSSDATARSALSSVGRSNISSYRSKYLQDKESRETKQQPDVVQVREPVSSQATSTSEVKSHTKSDACPCADCEDANQTSTIAAAIRAKKKRESRRPTGRISFDITNTSEESNTDASSREESVEIQGKEEAVVTQPQPLSQRQSTLGQRLSTSTASSCESTIDYKKLYELQHNSNQRLREDIQELKQELTNCRHELALIRNSAEMAGSAELNFDQKDKRTMERRVSELEEELKTVETLRMDNQRLKDENAALIRVISKLSK